MCKTLAKAFLEIIPMPKNDDHSDVPLGPLLDHFKDVKSDSRVQEYDNDALRLLEERFVSRARAPPLKMTVQSNRPRRICARP